jgi:hypothetical protein
VVSLDDADFMAQMGGKSNVSTRRFSSTAPTHMRSISDQEGMHQDARRRSGATSTPRVSATAESAADAVAADEKNQSESSDWDAEDGSGAVPAQSPATRRSRSRSTSPSTAAATKVGASAKPDATNHDEWDSSEEEGEGDGADARQSDGLHDEWDDSSDASPAAHHGK